MGAFAFFAGVLLSLMGLGRWQETGSPYWLIGSLVLFLLVLLGALTGKKKTG
ncbi:hypothetical protein F4556_004894 [Kitasatospora gansuensis]|uniref:Uncharacterized protein n=1 Tax=Kitasatospora gansuensis TaxID=258050 RepID=A0A7W7SF82_9ACTN|nr:hypothetical protein [Kitasatospora gansuensis]MBB4949359.1 hypothetical protein [Kitasatospora gansuensis]